MVTGSTKMVSADISWRLAKKLISYIRNGKITFAHSFNFEKMTDGMFEMEYDELTFRIRLYEAIGFLG